MYVPFVHFFNDGDDAVAFCTFHFGDESVDSTRELTLAFLRSSKWLSTH